MLKVSFLTLDGERGVGQVTANNCKMGEESSQTVVITLL